MYAVSQTCSDQTLNQQTGQIKNKTNNKVNLLQSINQSTLLKEGNGKQ